MLEIPEHQFCLMSFNILYGGTHLGQSLEQTAAVIRLAQADIVVACEQWGNAEPLADLLLALSPVANSRSSRLPRRAVNPRVPPIVNNAVVDDKAEVTLG